MHLGIIADDFTGATDIASFLVNNGMSTIQFSDIPASNTHVNIEEVDAIVISLKSRSCPAREAVEQSLAALRWLQQIGCKQFYFKYCSTFDSTRTGNIGPVTDALLDALGTNQTVISPALPVNGRTVYKGYLFVMDQLLSESGMRNHPVNPMLDSNLIRLMEMQSSGKCGLIPFETIENGSDAITKQLHQLNEQGIRYAVLDALTEQHLITQGQAVEKMKLVTGGSGLAIGIAKQFCHINGYKKQAAAAGKPQGKKSIVLSGSCSVMTNKQVANYQKQAKSYAIDISILFDTNKNMSLHLITDYAKTLCSWAEENSGQELAPLIYATTSPDELKKIQQTWGAENASQAVEQLFTQLTHCLQQAEFDRYIIAGGETSGAVVQALNIKGFHIGPTISPGVPWVRATDKPLSLALKSGNFGDEDFFIRAQREFIK